MRQRENQPPALPTVSLIAVNPFSTNLGTIYFSNLSQAVAAGRAHGLRFAWFDAVANPRIGGQEFQIAIRGSTMETLETHLRVMAAGLMCGASFMVIGLLVAGAL